MRPFKDRAGAGRQLARSLDFLRGRDVGVLGLPRGGVPVAVLVDDGVATGATAEAACQVARAHGAGFQGAGPGPNADDPPLRDEEVEVTAGPVVVAGHLTVPERSSGIVVFAHGSGSSRFSARNIYVADVLNASGIATLLFDLLTPAEERNRANVFDIELLSRRLVDVTDWLAGQPDAAALPVGYFGASTGAGAALVAACHPRVNISAVVSRGGRPDLAGESLGRVHAPTLLIVGGRDEMVLELNRQAQAAIPGTCELVVVPGATHLFEEPGTLEQVGVLARDWFLEHLGSARHRQPGVFDGRDESPRCE